MHYRSNLRRRGVGLAIVWLWGMLALLGACRASADVPVVRLQANGDAPVAGGERASGKLPLRVAVAAVLSPEATFDTYGPLLDYFAVRLDRPVELLQRSTYGEINELIRTGQADVGFICGGAYVEGERDGYLELLAAPVVENSTYYHSLLIVPAASGAQTLDDLQGRRFAFTDPLSHSGRLYIQYLLAQRGTTPETFFATTLFTYSHDNSVRAVADGLVDGAAVDSLVYVALAASEPALTERIRVIHRSPPFGIPPVVVHPQLDTALKAALRAALLDLDRQEAMTPVLQQLHVDGFAVVDNALYDEIRQMAASVRGWTTPKGPAQP